MHQIIDARHSFKVFKLQVDVFYARGTQLVTRLEPDDAEFDVDISVYVIVSMHG